MANQMKFEPIPEVQGAYVIRPPRFSDHRGFFEEIWHKDKYPEEIAKQLGAVPQVSFSVSNKNVARGIHASCYPKIVFCLKGAIRDYVIDIREESPTFGKHAYVDMNEDSLTGIYFPPYVGHAFFSKQGIFLKKKTSLLAIV